MCVAISILGGNSQSGISPRCNSLVLKSSFLGHHQYSPDANMASTNTQPRYPDFPEAGQKHRKIFDGSLLRPLQPVLPPGLDQSQFDRAISELVNQLGVDSVFIGEALRDYVDP